MGISLTWNIFFISALSQSIFVTIILFFQYFKSKQLSQLYLGAFIFVFTTILLNNFIFWNQLFSEYPHFIYSTVSTRFLLAPLFYLFCQSYFRFTFSKKDLLHFLPFIILTIIYGPFLFQSAAGKIESVTTFLEVQTPMIILLGKIVSWLLAVQLIAYPILIFNRLKNNWSNKEEKLDDHKINQIKWLNFLNFLFLIYGICMFIYFVMIAFEIGGLEKDFYISFVMCIAVYSISYKNMTDQNLLKGAKILDQIDSLKYNKTQLKKEYLEDTISKLEKVMQVEKIYLESDLDLNHVSQKISTPRHHISQALNLELDKTFHEYLNSYRINYACQLLQNLPKESNIKTVMYASGFNNRVSFSSNFKKIKGMTASDYLKGQKQTSSKSSFK
ncbi:MAG: helix-turn-helix domain-containing protein [Saprospiraceae bacterium]